MHDDNNIKTVSKSEENSVETARHGQHQDTGVGSDGRDVAEGQDLSDVSTEERAEADALLERIAAVGAVCNFCWRSRHVSVMQFNDLADHWECKDEVDCAVAGQWT